jgi:hypothetical protein
MRFVGGAGVLWAVIALGAVSATPHALAKDEGPFEGDTESSIRGGLVPRQKTTVRLRAEELAIAIDPDGTHYDVSAKYLLSNPDAETTVRFGVPLLFEPDQPKAAQHAANAVRIKVGDQESRCALLKETVTLDANLYENLEVTPQGGWCAARLTIPHGDAVPLLFTYRGDLLLRDESGTESAFLSFGRRELRHVFFPAGHWVGPAERVAVTVDLGRFAGLEQVVSPPGAVKQGDKLTWTFTNVDLKKVPDLLLKVDVTPIANLTELAKYRKESKVALAAKAAKAAGDATAASRAVDGDPETAWCVDKPSPDRWIEITQRRIAPGFRDCNWEGVLLVSSTGDKTARIKRIRLESCSGARAAKPVFVDVPVKRVGARGPWGLILSSDLYSEVPKADVEAFVQAFRAVEEKGRTCVRVSVVEVEGSGPACIGELVPLRACG